MRPLRLYIFGGINIWCSLHRKCVLVLDCLVCDATLLPRRNDFVTDQKTFMLGGQILQVKCIYVNHSRPFILPFFEQVCT